MKLRRLLAEKPQNYVALLEVKVADIQYIMDVTQKG